MPIHDNDSAKIAPLSSDAHGMAALLLVESLIHGLCEDSTLSNEAALNIVETAVDVQFNQADAEEKPGASMWQSHALLSAIAASLRIDGLGRPTPPRLVV